MNSNVSRSAAMWLGCGVLALNCAACASGKPPANEPVAMGEMTHPGPQWPSTDGDTTRNDADTTIRVSDEFRRECQLPNAPKDAPHFDYADSTLRAHGANILDDVAKCLSEGPLRGRVMTIIGRTDKRGSAAYNKTLSGDRAAAVRNYLVQHGVPTSNMRIVAHGEQGAQGTDEETWAKDRRVDIELGERSAATANALPDPVMEGTRLQALSPSNTTSKSNGASYSDSGEGSHESGTSSPGKGSASGSVNAGASK
jgi:peptidoglycan-associated lipoprotein